MMTYPAYLTLTFPVVTEFHAEAGVMLSGTNAWCMASELTSDGINHIMGNTNSCDEEFAETVIVEAKDLSDEALILILTEKLGGVAEVATLRDAAALKHSDGEEEEIA